MPFPLMFCGPGTRLTLAALQSVAARTMLDLASIEAVMMVETGNGSGFLGDGTGRLKALFESGKFGNATGHRFDESHPLLSTRGANWKLYRGGAAEYERLGEALTLDRNAALESTSWGLFQILGSNFDMLGYRDAEAMVAAFIGGEQAQLDGFVAYCQARHLLPLLRARNWSEFARIYNGPDYQRNNYAERLATAYATVVTGTYPFITLGSAGSNVKRLQVALTAAGFPLVADGSFGPATAFAVRRFQSSRGMVVDGLPGELTMAALHLAARP